MAEYISKDNLNRYFDNCLKASGNIYATALILALKDDLNSKHDIEAVEVVRCKKCKYWRPNWCVAPGYYRCIEWPSATREHDFCSRGERREHENT